MSAATTIESWFGDKRSGWFHTARGFPADRGRHVARHWRPAVIGSRGPQSGRLEKVWGLAGASPGRLFRPRAIAIDKSDLLYIVDMTPQIQVFTGDGELVRGWQPPKFETGQPSGLVVR